MANERKRVSLVDGEFGSDRANAAYTSVTQQFQVLSEEQRDES